MIEIWKDVPNYEGIYQVSNLGNVKSLNRKIVFYDKSINNIKQHNLKGKILKGRISGKLNGQYFAVSLNLNNKVKQYKIHQLVAMAFLNHKPCGYNLIVDHINNDKFDNKLENLQLISQRENSYRIQGKYSSKYKGVSWCKNKKTWRARYRLKGKEILIGYYKNEYDAHLEYQKIISNLTL
jgi:hypothetical protein